jgi:hypothetical protein
VLADESAFSDNDDYANVYEALYWHYEVVEDLINILQYEDSEAKLIS